jgi:hypothetical protein
MRYSRSLGGVIRGILSRRMTTPAVDGGAGGARVGADRSTGAAQRRPVLAFLNSAHALHHFVILIYPTVVIELERVALVTRAVDKGRAPQLAAT